MRHGATRHLITVVLALAAGVVQPAGASTAGDFDADGNDEILLRHGDTGEWVYYDLDADFAVRVELPLDMADTVRFQGIGDFDGDGADEVLARDVEDQSWRYFDLTDDGVVERHVPGMTRHDYWSVPAIGDFDGDGTDDIMIRRLDRGVSFYYAMDGTDATLVRNIGVTHNTLYEVVGAGDFDGDGHDDILLRHTRRGDWVFYDMAGTRGALRRPGLTRNVWFEFEAIGDFNGDGRDDVMLRHTRDGEWIYYAMRSNHRGALTRGFGMPRDRVHRLVGAGDFDGDGDASPLLRHPHTSAWHSYDLGVSPAQRTGHPGMTRDLAWTGATETGSDALSAEVVEIGAGSLIRMPANHFDLEGKTVTFTPAGEGEYTVTVGELDWHEPGAGRVESQELYYIDSGGMTVDLPFAFPFAGRTWTRFYANANGNISFHRPERDNWWDRNPSDPTMRSVAATIDSRSVTGLEAMIAALWGPHGATNVTSDVTADTAVATWRGGRLRPFPTENHLFQARLHATGVVELAWHRVRERDGIVGLFHGLNRPGTTVDAVEDAAGDVADPTVDILGVEFVDHGSVVLARMTLARKIPASFQDREIVYRLMLRFGGRDCHAGVALIASGYRPFLSGCYGYSVGYRINGTTLEIPISKTLFDGGNHFSWNADAVSGGEQFDQLFADREVHVEPAEVDLSVARPDALAGNVFEAFHYPVMPRNPRRVLSYVYGHVPDNAEIAVTLTDFRFDDLFGIGTATGAVNEAVQGIGPSQANPTPGDQYGSANLLASMVPSWLGGPIWRVSGVHGSGRTFDNVAGGTSWITHEAVHRWAAHLRFRNPVSGAIEDLLEDGCRCHWNDYLHTPTVHPVWHGYSDRPYVSHSTMGGRVWTDNGDGTFTRARDDPDDTFWYPKGLSALDLYAMGMIPASEVPDTFILRDVEPTEEWHTVKAMKVPVRIEDIVSVMGPRLPNSREARRDFRLAVYLLHEDGRPPHRDSLQRARAVSPAVIEYFDRATGGRMRVVPSSATADDGRTGTGEAPEVRWIVEPTSRSWLTGLSSEIRCDHPPSAHRHGRF